MATTSAGASSPRVPLIIDTDIFTNSDDVGALATAFSLQMKGEANVVAIGVDTRTNRPSVATNSWKCVAAIAQYYGDGTVPIGSDMPDNATTVNNPDMVGPCAALAAPSTPAPGAAVDVYRRALVSQADGTVQMVGVGYEENLSALLHSAPDAISPLNGHDLIAQKVKSLTIMGGGYPSRSGENNLTGNPSAAEDVAANWPTKVVYSGYEVGFGVFTGHTLSSRMPVTSPVRVAYEAIVGAGKNNRSWDLTALYHAVRPNDPLLSEVGPGTNVVDSNGGNVFTPGADNEYYLTNADSTSLQNTLEGLLDVLPGTTPQAITFTSTAPSTANIADTYTVTATGGGSANPVTFSIDASSTSGCTVAAGVVTFSAPAGSCVIDANQSGDATYSAAAQVQQTVTVLKTPQTITFTSVPPASPQQGHSYSVAATASSHLAVALTVDASTTRNCHVSGALVTIDRTGQCLVDANQPGNATFAAAPQVQQAFAKGTQTIRFTTSPPSSPRIGGTYAAAATGGASGNPVTFSIDASSTAGCTVNTATGLVSFGVPSGTCVLDANQAGSATFAAAAQVQQSFFVSKAAQSITFTSSIPSSPQVGGTYIVAATASSGLAVTIAISGGSASICSLAGATVTFLMVGSCVVNANQAGNAVYAAAPQVQQSISVAKASQTIAFTSTPPAPAHAGGTYVVAATASSGLAVTFSVQKGSVCVLSGSTVTFTAKGTCTINANQGGNASYLAAPQVQQFVSVT